MIWYLAVVLFLMNFSDAYADYKAGITIDSSSNMLMQPDGESGSFLRLEGAYGRSIFKKLYFSYDTELGFLQHYDGIQFHNHELSLGCDIISKDNLIWSSSISGNLARFGDVTLIDGYNSYGFESAIKYYIFPTFLVRWGINIDKKDFINYENENYQEAETYLRLDKFLKTRTTLRLQLDSGLRKYINVMNEPVSEFTEGKFLIAQSFNDITGANVEFHISSTDTGFSPSDSSQVYNRIFLDDKYKYSREGVTVSLSRLIQGGGMIKLSGFFNERKYNKGAVTIFDYLPENGWTEKEKGVSFTLSYSPEFFPDLIHPSCRLYYIDVNSSESVMSYDTAGISVTLSIF